MGWNIKDNNKMVKDMDGVNKSIMMVLVIKEIGKMIHLMVEVFLFKLMVEDIKVHSKTRDVMVAEHMYHQIKNTDMKVSLKMMSKMVTVYK
jgi:hypothetical protein